MSQDSPTDKFVSLYTACQRRLYVYVRSHVPLAADCDDVLQNVSAVLWEKFAEYRPEEDFTRWAFGVARLEILKYRQKQAGRTTQLRLELADIVAQETLDVSEAADTLSEMLRKCVEKLSPWNMVILRQRFDDGKSVHEIAQKLNRSDNAVYKILQSIYDSLYDCVKSSEAGRTRP